MVNNLQKTVMMFLSPLGFSREMITAVSEMLRTNQECQNFIRIIQETDNRKLPITDEVIYNAVAVVQKNARIMQRKI